MVIEQQTSTPMQEWVAQALERMQPILDGVKITGRRLDIEDEDLSDILERVEWLAQHFKVMPEPCCKSALYHVTAYAEGHSAGYLDATLWALGRVKEIRAETEAKNESSR